MNKTQLIDHLVKNTDFDRSNARVAVDAVIEALTESLASGDHVTLLDFGSFGITRRAARNGFNPRLKKQMHVEATSVVKFTASAKLKQLVKQAKFSED